MTRRRDFATAALKLAGKISDLELIYVNGVARLNKVLLAADSFENCVCVCARVPLFVMYVCLGIIFKSANGLWKIAWKNKFLRRQEKSRSFLNGGAVKILSFCAQQS